MAGCPRWANTPSSTFQEAFFMDGFNGAFVVSTDQPLGFFQLLGYILFMHHAKGYPQIRKVLELEWTKRVAPVIAVFETADGNALSDPEWWNKAGESCRNIIIKYFCDAGKEHFVKKLKASQPVSHNDAPFLGKLAKDFLLCLVWMERTSEDTVVHLFQPDTRNEVGLCVYLAEESGSLHLLIHQTISEVPTSPTSSHYILIGESVKHYSPQAGAPQSPRSPILAEQRTQVASSLKSQSEAAIVNALARIVLTSCHGALSDAAAGSQGDLRSALETFKQAKELMPDVTSEVQIALLQEILELKVKSAKQLPKQHTIHSCERHPSAEPMKKVCMHSFHQGCIRIYIENLHAWKQEIICPICGRPINHQEINEISPSIYNDLFFTKMQNIQYATTGSNRSYESSFNPSIYGSATLPQQSWTCWQCRNTLDMGGRHGAHLCYKCFSCTAYSTRVCPSCHQPYSAEDYPIQAPAISR